MFALFLPLLNPTNWPVIALVGVLAYGAGWWRGDAHGDRQCEARIARDKIEQDRKIADAGKEVTAWIGRWNEQKGKVNELTAKLDAEADAAPSASNVCFTVDSLRRINRATGGPK